MFKRLATLATLLLLASTVACGTNSENESNGSNGTPLECTPGEEGADEFCKDRHGDNSIYLRPENLHCAWIADNNSRCVECQEDSECNTGEACSNAFYCYALDPCSSGSECPGGTETAHWACSNNTCQQCESDADCESGEVCFDREDVTVAAYCVDSGSLDPDCADGTCQSDSDRSCEMQRNSMGDLTGFDCIDVDPGEPGD